VREYRENLDRLAGRKKAVVAKKFGPEQLSQVS
jgi:hypothetical protein